MSSSFQTHTRHLKSSVSLPSLPALSLPISPIFSISSSDAGTSVTTSIASPLTGSAPQVHPSTPVVSTALYSTPTTSTSSQPSAAQPDVSGSHRSRNIIIGTMVPIGLLVPTLVLLVIWVRIRRRNQRALHPEPRRVSPFMQGHVPPPIARAPSDGHSITASSVRRQYLERELRAAQEKLVDIGDLERRQRSISRAAPTALFHALSARGRSMRHNSQRVPKSELDAAHQRNEELLARIRDLEAQMESAWALGLSDEPPPGYSD